MNNKKNIQPRFKKFKEPGDAARLQRMILEMERGFDFLKAFDDNRVVTVFGSAQTPPSSKIYQQARQLGVRLAQEEIVVATGGGPGIMEAANLGAFEAGGQSVGINIYLGEKERRNDYVTESIGFHYFFARKVILAHIAQAYVYFPGGFGTLDEFFEISTLVATNKIEEKMPIVLFGKAAYWKSMLTWLEKTCIQKNKTIHKEQLKMWHVTDSVDEAIEIVRKIPANIHRHESV